MLKDPEASVLSVELQEVGQRLAEEWPNLARDMRQRVLLLGRAPRGSGGVAWLAKCGDPAAKLAGEFYSGPPSGRRRRG